MSNKLTRSEMLRDLRKGPCTVVFTKSDRTRREMRCTLDENVLPAYDGKNGGDDRHVINVWDLDKRAWRSFRVEAVRSFKRVA